MKTAKFWLSGLLVLTFSFVAEATDYYFEFDPGCMERLEYRYEETMPGSEFVIYALPVNATEKIYLQVGMEGRAPLSNSVPRNLLTCRSEEAPEIGLDFIEAVNNQIHRVFIVSAADRAGRYRVAQVNGAYYFSFDGREIVCRNNQYDFRYTLGATQGGNLALNGLGSVYFIQQLSLGDCDAYQFRQTLGFQNSLDLYVVPQVGVIEEKASNANTSFRLNRVNNTPVESYLDRVCAGEAGPVVAYGNVLTPKSPATTTQAPQRKVHTVAKGETLFGIALQHRTSMGDLQNWNNLQGSLIREGMQLFVEPLPAVGPTSYSAGAGVLTSRGAATTSAGSLPPWKLTKGTHLVQPGESVAGLARLYGYTEERFRFFNELEPNQQIQAGEMLKTTDCEPSLTVPQTGAAGPTSYGQESLTSTASEQTTDPLYEDPFTTPQARPSQPAYQVRETAQPSSYGALPAGTTAKGGTNTPDYSRNYGPVPGAYNNNRPLYEPFNRTSSSTAQPATSASPQPYSTVPSSSTARTASSPSSYGDSGLTAKGLEDRMGTRPSSYSTRSAVPAGVRKTHTVKEGETLFSIARRYGTTADRLRELNGFEKNEVVIPFQRIYVN